MMISVIMPIYNAAEYLPVSIESIRKQTYENWELIAVDDGSKDSSLKVLEQYAKDDARITVLHQENAGPGVARNAAISHAKGDYLVFVDSDDYLSPDYFALLIPAAEKKDVVFIDIDQVDQQGNLLSREAMSEHKELGIDQITRSQMTGKIPWGGVRKAVSRKLVIDNDIRYTSHSIGEEALYSFKLMLHARSVGFLDEKPVYFYVNRKGSQSKKGMDDPWGDVVETIRQYTVEKGIYPQYANTLNAFETAALVVSLDRIARYYRGKTMWLKAKERFAYYQQKIDSNYGIDKLNLTYKARVFMPLLQIACYQPVLMASIILNRKR